MNIRPETRADIDTVHALNTAAFPSAAEAQLVDHLRREATPLISLVAEADNTILGHILFSPVILDSQPDLELMGLAPMAVLPARQSAGIGSQLVIAGLAQCRQAGAGAVLVLGHPEFYPRFGFRPAHELGLDCDYDVPNEAFMALELIPGYLQDYQGRISYHPLFNSL